MHYQCTYEAIPDSSENKKWCCTQPDCDATLEWDECPGIKWLKFYGPFKIIICLPSNFIYIYISK